MASLRLHVVRQDGSALQVDYWRDESDVVEIFRAMRDGLRERGYDATLELEKRSTKVLD